MSAHEWQRIVDTDNHVHIASKLPLETVARRPPLESNCHSSVTGHSLLDAKFAVLASPSASISCSRAPSMPHTTGYVALLDPPSAGTYRADGENAANSAVCLAFGDWLASDPCAASNNQIARSKQ